MGRDCMNPWLPNQNVSMDQEARQGGTHSEDGAKLLISWQYPLEVARGTLITMMATTTIWVDRADSDVWVGLRAVVDGRWSGSHLWWREKVCLVSSKWLMWSLGGIPGPIPLGYISSLATIKVSAWTKPRTAHIQGPSFYPYISPFDVPTELHLLFHLNHYCPIRSCRYQTPYTLTPLWYHLPLCLFLLSMIVYESV